MKYFTREAQAKLQTNGRSLDAAVKNFRMRIAKYREHAEKLRKSIEPSEYFILDSSFHDWKVVTVQVDEQGVSIGLKRQHMSRTVRFLDPDLHQMDISTLVGQYWLQDELELSQDGRRVVSILFDKTEVSIPCRRVMLS